MFKDATHVKTAAQLLKALSNGYRLQIVNQLLHGEKNVTDLNKGIKISQPALSQHLSKLRGEGVLGARRNQRQIYYYISNTHVIRLLGVAAEMAVDGAVAKKR
jgi:DNA-binding transcriptional ArsR family regulator